MSLSWNYDWYVSSLLYEVVAFNVMKMTVVIMCFEHVPFVIILVLSSMKDLEMRIVALENTFV